MISKWVHHSVRREKGVKKSFVFSFYPESLSYGIWFETSEYSNWEDETLMGLEIHDKISLLPPFLFPIFPLTTVEFPGRLDDDEEWIPGREWVNGIKEEEDN